MKEAENEEDKKYIRPRGTTNEHNRSPKDHYTGARTIQNSLGPGAKRLLGDLHTGITEIALLVFVQCEEKAGIRNPSEIQGSTPKISLRNFPKRPNIFGRSWLRKEDLLLSKVFFHAAVDAKPEAGFSWPR